jgi:hypothetical protein
LALDIELLGDESALVTGAAAPHFVAGCECDCPDAHNPAEVRKHRLAAHLARQLDATWLSERAACAGQHQHTERERSW